MQSAPEPLSWLTLERYALGELSAEERAEVEARLAASEVDRACLAEITSDKSELPPLAGSAVSTLKPSKKRRRNQWLAGSAALCAAALALIAVLREPAHLDDHVKGSEVALRIVSDRQGSDPTRFSVGERFKVQVSCPPSLSETLRLFVLQGEEVFEPLPRDASFRCNNLATWPGAFALDGAQSADVCMYWGRSAKPTKQDFAHDAVCQRLAGP
jgi:hypothetical protein